MASHFTKCRSSRGLAACFIRIRISKNSTFLRHFRDVFPGNFHTISLVVTFSEALRSHENTLGLFSRFSEFYGTI